MHRTSIFGAVCGYKYFLKLPAVRLTASPSKAALGSRISSGCTEIGEARYVTGIDISDKLPPEGLETGANGRILCRDAARVGELVHLFGDMHG